MESCDEGYGDGRFSGAVDEDLHCPICLNVLKDPVQCQANEHHFCTPCITKHLQNSLTCPSCMEPLSVEGLKKPARYLTKHLCQLKICCDYENRGCPEVVKLEDLRGHVATCGFAPVNCSNDGCGKVINKDDRIRHETEICNFRRVKCHDCAQLRKEIGELKAELKTSFDELKGQVCQMMVKINGSTNPRSNISHLSSDDFKEDIIIVGGFNGTFRLKSAEIFVWSKMKWLPLNSAKDPRSGSTAVIYKNQLLVAGGRTGEYSFTNSIEVLQFVDKQNSRWYPHPAKLPFPCGGHRCMIYQDSLLLIGGLNLNEVVSSGIYEVCLHSPYSAKLLSRIPQPRTAHGMACFADKIVIIGGKDDDTFHKTVVLFDVKTKECGAGFRLPYPVHGMATVTWGDHVVLIGGKSDGKVLNTAMMYNFKTGHTHMLPPMKHKRFCCTAVSSKNVVLGGINSESEYLSAVEYFSLSTYSWIELPPMNEKRSSPGADVRPGNMMYRM